MKPDIVKILTVMGNNPVMFTTTSVPEELTKKVDIPHRCGRLYKGKNLYGYYSYGYLPKFQ